MKLQKALDDCRINRLALPGYMLGKLLNANIGMLDQMD